MDSRLEALIVDAEWLVKQKPATEDNDTRENRHRRIECMLIQIDKILQFENELLDDCRVALEKMLHFGLKIGRQNKRMLTATLSIATKTSQYSTCMAGESLFKRLMSTFFRLHATKRMEYIYDLSCISKTMQNIILNDGIRELLEQPRHLEALLSVCERGFCFDTPEISPKLIMAIMFKWPRATGIKSRDEEYSNVMNKFLKLILVKMEVEKIKNNQSRIYLMFSLICVVDTAHKLLRDSFATVLSNLPEYDIEKADNLFEEYLNKWLEISTNEQNLNTELALISCRALRRVMVTPLSVQPRIFSNIRHKLVPKSIYIVDNLICRLKRLNEDFNADDDDEDADSKILNHSPYDRLIPQVLYRFLMASKASQPVLEPKTTRILIDEHSKRRLLRIIDFIFSNPTIVIYADGRVTRSPLKPHPNHIWTDYIEQAINEVQACHKEEKTT